MDRATFDANSTVIYRGSSSLTPAVSMAGRTYGSLTFESTSGSWTASVSGATAVTINGNFTIGSGVTYSNALTAVVTHAGNFTQNGTLTNGAGTQNYTFTGSGKTIGGTGTIEFETWNINSGASITLAQNVSIPSTFTGTVNSGGTLNADNKVVSGAGTFTLASGGTLGIGSAAGITSSGATGNIQTTNRNFNTGANYTYNGTVAQATGTGLPATVNNLTISTSGGTVTLTNASVTASSNMTVATGSTFDANGNSVTVTGILENDGTLRQTLAVNGTGAVNFFNTGSYGGAVLDAAAGGDLGSTLVVIRGNRACDTTNSMIRRCYDIQPTNTSGRSATVKLAYYTTPDNEENGQTCGSLEMYHWDGTMWVVAGNTPTYSCGGTTRTIQKVGVTSFSPFGMSGPSAPTAITLLRFTAVPAGPPVYPLHIPLFALFGLSWFGLVRRRRAGQPDCAAD